MKINVADLRGKYGLVLMGIKYDNKQDLINEMNSWNKEIGNAFIPDGEFVDFEEIYTLNDRTDILIKHTGTVNPIARIEYRDMGWVWAEDYVANRYYE